MKKVVVWMMSTLCLVSCASQYSTSDKQQYLTAKNGAALVITPPLTDSNISGFYDLPAPQVAAKVSLVPPQG